MKNIKNEKGITLVTLVIMVIVIFIISGIGVTAGTGTIKYSKYMEFQSELKIVQSKINEISEQYQKEGKEIGIELTSDNIQVLNTTEVTEQLNKKTNKDNLQEIKNAFRLCTKEYLAENFDLEGLTRDYLVNLEQCIVVSSDVFNYDGVNYYMLEQMSTGLYNVTYNNQIEPTGTFTATYEKVDNEYEITIDVQHSKYVSKWLVKYKLENTDEWKITNNLTFTVDTAGTYVIQITHGDEVDLGEQTLVIE